MEKKNTLLIIVIVFSIFSNISIIQVLGEEWENTDSYNIHDQNRWEVVTNTATPTKTINNGIMTIEDNSSAYQNYLTRRLLSKTDLKLKGRIKSPNMTLGNFYDDASHSWKNNRVFSHHMNSGTGTTSYDSTDNNYDGTFLNTPEWEFSFNNSAEYSLHFNESNADIVRIPDENDFSFTDFSKSDTAFSVSVWIKREAGTNDDRHILSKWNTVTPEREWRLFLDTSAQLNFILFDETNNAQIGRSTTQQLDENWNFVVVSYDGSESSAGIDIYLNNTIADTSNENTGSYAGMDNTTQEIRIGGRNSANEAWNGSIDEVVLWDTELSQSEIAELYNDYLNPPEQFYFRVGVTTETGAKANICFEMLDMNSSGPVLVYYEYISDNVIRRSNFYNISRTTWYRFEIKLDTYKSELEFEIEEDNGDSISNSDKTYLDISTTYHPDIFAYTQLYAFWELDWDRKGGTKIEIDFIEAPFEEYEFQLHKGPDNATLWNETNEFGVVWNNNGTVGTFNDTVQYRITVPEYDYCSGVLYAGVNTSDVSDIDDGAYSVGVKVYNVNATTGDLIRLGRVLLGYDGIGVGCWAGAFDWSTYYGDYISTGASLDEKVEGAFNIYLSNATQMVFQIAFNGETRSYSTVRSMSSEFVIELEYNIIRLLGPTDPLIVGQFGLKEWQLAFRDVFSFLGDIADIDGPTGAIFDGVGNILMQGFRLLGGAIGTMVEALQAPLNLIKIAVDSVKTAIDSVITAVGNLPASIFSQFNSILSTIDTAIDNVKTAIESVITAVENLPDYIATALTDLFEDVTDALDALAAAMWTSFIAAVDDLMDAVANALDVVVEAALTALSSYWDLVVAFIQGFFNLLFDTIVSPLFAGVKAYIDLMITGLQTVYSLAVTAWNFIVQYPYSFFAVITLYLFWGSLANADDMIDYAKNWVDIAFKDVTGGTSLLGFHIHVPLISVWGFSLIFWQLVEYTF